MTVLLPYEITEPEYFDLAGLIERTRPTWMAKGSCRDYPQEWWYPDRGEWAEAAKGVCGECPVRATCLDHALTNGEHHGIWGGKSERQRQRMRRSA